MADGGRYRKRRHAVFAVSADGIVRQPAQPHYQSRDYNTLNGGIERWFEPVTEPVGAGPSMTTILTFCRTLFGTLSPDPGLARRGASVPHRGPARPGGSPNAGGHASRRRRLRAGAAGEPHQHRQRRDLGARSGGNALGDFTLTPPFDAALVDDARVMHGVTPVEPLDPAEPGFRDVLVVTFRRA